MKVFVLPNVREFFDELESALYEKGYFGFEEQAHRYADELFLDIKNNLPRRQHKKPRTNYFERYGKNLLFASFRKNKQTEWYAFFTTHEVENEKIYLVRYVANNHTVAQYL